MKRMVKFSSQVDEAALKHLREFSAQENKDICHVLTEAIEEYLKNVQVRPAFTKAAKHFISQNRGLLKRLAK